MASWFKSLNWKKIAATVIGGILLLGLGGTATHTAKGWLGSGVGLIGVRSALATHESDASVHPKQELLEQRFESLEDKVQALEDSVTKDVDRLEKAQTKNTDRILDALKNRSN